MNKKNLTTVFLLILFVFGLGFSFPRLLAQWENSRRLHQLYKGPITIGMETWPGYIPFFIARDKGYFKEAHLDVSIKRYPGLGQLSKDYLAGKMQGRANLTLDALNECLSGLDHKIVLAIDYSNGSDAIVATKEIKTVKDFKGKQVGYEPNTLEEFFVAWELNENEMSLLDVTSVFGSPEETAKLLKEGKVDVAVSHEPYLSRFVSSGEFHVVNSSADAPGLITDVLTFRTDFIKAHPETVQAITRAYFKALKFWKDHPEEADAIVAKEFGDSPESIENQMKGITMLDERDNKTAFTFAVGLRSLYGNMRQIGEFVQNHQQIHLDRFNTDSLIERRFVVALSE